MVELVVDVEFEVSCRSMLEVEFEISCNSRRLCSVVGNGSCVVVWCILFGVRVFLMVLQHVRERLAGWFQ